jgi:hypothetical protein
MAASGAPNGIETQALYQRIRMNDSKESYLERLVRWTRGHGRQHWGENAAAPGSRTREPGAAAVTPGRSRAQEQIWSDVIQRRTCNGNIIG